MDAYSRITSKDGAVSSVIIEVKNHQPLPSSLHEGISSLLSRWTALQMAVQNGWGGDDSFNKSLELVSEIDSWFSQPKTFLNLDDLESLLHEKLLLSFNTEIEDGSIEEVAEELMAMHDEVLNRRNFVSSITSSQKHIRLLDSSSTKTVLN